MDFKTGTIESNEPLLELPSFLRPTAKSSTTSTEPPLELPSFLRPTSRSYSSISSSQAPVFRSMIVGPALSQHAFRDVRDVTPSNNNALLTVEKSRQSIGKPTSHAASSKLADAKCEAPPCPTFLERSSSFLSNMEPGKLFSRLLSCLKKMENVAVSVTDLAKYSIRGKAVVNQRFACFKANIFTQVKDGKVSTIVEIQKRSGEGNAFRSFYASLLHELQEIVLETMQHAPNEGLFQKTQLPQGKPLAEPTLSSPSALKSLIRMASSECPQNKREALEHLAEMCEKRKSNEKISLLKETSLMSEVKSALFSEDCDIVRCAVSILDSCASCPCLQEDILCMMDHLRQHLAASNCPMTLRYIGSVVRDMSEKNGSKMGCPKLREALRKFDCDRCDDKVLVASAKKSLENISKELKKLDLKESK